MEWFILFSPLIACVIITLITLRSPLASRLIALSGLFVSLALSAGIAYQAVTQGPHWQPYEMSFKWIDIWSLQIEFGLLFDRLSILMLLIVTSIGSCIFIYSMGYMHDDPGHSRYFAYLSLFMFSMLGIVLSNNFIQMFIFWELVGASSYLLIGFWFEKDSAADAGNKAFLVNRVGDFGFMLGILMCWVVCGAGATGRTFNFAQLESILPRVIESGFASPGILALIGLLIFCGVLGKSAQFPLHVWLPDAMEGPTPVSALIHAATMVAAGIYLVARTFFLFESSPEAMSIIAHIGAFTGIFAASIALVQNDIKRILAYSTLSQLGLMVMTLGLGAFSFGHPCLFQSAFVFGRGKRDSRPSHAKYMGHGQIDKKTAHHFHYIFNRILGPLRRFSIERLLEQR
jgi:NADH-quinone oxidoreductase subunit L